MMKSSPTVRKKMYSFQDVDFATEILLDEAFSAGYDEGLEQEFELDDDLEQDDLDYLCDSYVEGSLFGWDS
jgi:hypothetical protein